MKLPAFLSALAGRPKNFEAAAGTLAEAKTFADSVGALFSAAGLNLESMLAAGPDALKAHLASLDQSAEVTRLTAEAKTATDALGAFKAEHAEAAAQVTAFADLFATIGLDLAGDTAPKAADFKTAFSAHVSKQVTVELAKSGHPPVVQGIDKDAAQSDEQIAAEYIAMSPGDARLAFFTKHEAAIRRAEQAARQKK